MESICFVVISGLLWTLIHEEKFFIDLCVEKKGAGNIQTPWRKVSSSLHREAQQVLNITYYNQLQLSPIH